MIVTRNSLLMLILFSVALGGCPGGGGNTQLCGDGVVDSPEECDDGNTVSGDGCSSTCEVECQADCTGKDCGDDGICDPYNEGCNCTDCVNHPSCPQHVCRPGCLRQPLSSRYAPFL